MKILLLLFPLILAQAHGQTADKGKPDAGVEELENKPDAGVLDEISVKESDTADKVYTHPSGRRIRVVGSKTASESVSETALGRVVETFTLQEESLCPVVFSAKPNETKKFPVVEGIETWTPMCPIVVNKDGDDWIWWAVLNSENCAVMAAYEKYHGSTLDEFISLPMPLRRKMLKTYGTCSSEVDGKTVERRCVVPIGDSKAIQGADVFFPHNLAGRTDINFKKYKNGKIQPRVKTSKKEAVMKEN